MGDELLITEARSTILPGKGRCVTSARTNHCVIDEPPHNGGPGEAFTPGETFLSSVLACGVLLVDAFAHKEGVPLKHVGGTVRGERLKDNPADWIAVKLAFELTGVDQKTAEALVEKYKAKCPIFRAFNAALKVSVTVVSRNNRDVS